MRRTAWKFAAAAVLSLGLMLSGCSKPAGDAAATEAAEAELAAAEQKLADAEKAIEEAQLAEGKATEARKALEDARRELEAARRTVAQTKTKAAPEGASGWSQGAGAAKPSAAPAAPAAPKPPREFTLDAGSRIAVRTTSTLTTKDHQNGHRFQATLTEPLEVDGYTIAPRGATVTGEVSNSDPGGRVKGVASIAVRLVSVQTAAGEPVAISTGAISQDAPTTRGKDAAKVGIGAGVGAAIGAIAGGGRGAAIGAAAGGAAGTGAAMATRGDPAVIPAETILTFTLSAPVTVTEKR